MIWEVFLLHLLKWRQIDIIALWVVLDVIGVVLHLLRGILPDGFCLVHSSVDVGDVYTITVLSITQ